MLTTSWAWKNPETLQSFFTYTDNYYTKKRHSELCRLLDFLESKRKAERAIYSNYIKQVLWGGTAFLSERYLECHRDT